ncbi:MAG: PIG-L family deacetylase [Saprospiraceae bacterium]
MRVIFKLLLCVIVLFPITTFGQAPKKWKSADIHEAIQKLNFLGSALYIAAHPDDENTRLIAYLANEVKANTAYLSLTRGDGGQNLIGPEIRELLGLIRTQELLAARRIDGGNQLFSRANDFGYSKHPDETLKIWNKEEVLSDVVWAIRKWQPDIIINRFDHRSEGTTHGHHTSSAMLSFEAFDLTADASVYPAQLKYVKPWQPKRLFFNTGWYFYGSQENFQKADKSNLFSVDVGVYYPILGKSNTEIAAESRSMHKCQGFGSAGSRGEELEYLEIIKGEKPTKDLFEGVNTTWTRVKGGAPIGEILTKVEQNFKYDAPYASLTDLISAYKLIQALPDGYWKQVKKAEIEQVIEACLGLYAEATANSFSATPGEDVRLRLEIINRSPAKVTLKSIQFLPSKKDTLFNQVLANNQGFSLQQVLTLPEDMPFTNPYWLNEEASLGMYTVEEQTLRGLPETPRNFQAVFDLMVEGIALKIHRPIVFKQTDPVKGEVFRPFEVTPPVYANFTNKVFIFGNSDAPKNVNILVKAGKDSLQGSLSLAHAPGWRVEPENIDFALNQKGEEQIFSFKLFPPKDQSEATITPKVQLGDRIYDQEAIFIVYDHIPVQTVYRQSVARVVKVDLAIAGRKVGYLMGAGDEIPTNLEQIGYEVTMLNDGDFQPDYLRQFDAIILGIRAYNTVDRLKFYQPKLLDYVKDGGNLIVQYNTSRGLKVPQDQMAPYPFKLSNDRVTVEEAEVRFLLPDHPVLNFPNKITSKDFEGWVQERGLYFPSEWDEHFQAILSCNDPNEPASDGGLLVAPYGHGNYIYTGYSWFRELPAGVPGAYRLFANMISIGKEERP